MRERIANSRDMFVVAVMSFGYGVLTSWALFYKWGSAPMMKAVDVSAWVQAIGSVIAIFVAAAIPIYLWQREEAIRVTQRRLKAKVHAMKIMPMIDQLILVTKRAEKRLSLRSAYKQLDDIQDSLKADLAWQDHYESLEHLGYAGELIQSAILSNNRLSRLLEEWDFYTRSGGIYYDPNSDEEHDVPKPEPWDNHLARSLGFAREIEEAIDVLLKHHAAASKS